MAVDTMGQSSEPMTRPKRKRATVNYYEGEEEELDLDDSYDEVPCGKKPKAKASTSETTTNVVKKKQRQLPKKKIFPFLELPPEIRNMIYREALVDENGIYLVPATVKYRRTVERADQHLTVRKRVGPAEGEKSDGPVEVDNPYPCRLVPALLALNKQIFSETQGMLYSNEFIMSDMQALHAFVMGLSQRCRDLLERITIETWGLTRGNKPYNHCAFAILSTCTNIKNLNLQGRTYNSGPELSARQVYRDGFHWLEAVGRAKGKEDAAVELITINPLNLNRWYWSQGRSQRKDPDDNLEVFRTALRQLLAEGKNATASSSRSKKKAKIQYAN